MSGVGSVHVDETNGSGGVRTEVPMMTTGASLEEEEENDDDDVEEDEKAPRGGGSRGGKSAVGVAGKEGWMTSLSGRRINGGRTATDDDSPDFLRICSSGCC